MDRLPEGWQFVVRAGGTPGLALAALLLPGQPWPHRLRFIFQVLDAMDSTQS